MGMSVSLPISLVSPALEPLLPWIRDWLTGQESRAPESDVEILKHSVLRLVLRVPHPDPQPDCRSVILKLYRRKGSIEALRSLWLRSRSLREKKNLDRARQRQIPCPLTIDAGHAKGLMPDLGWLVLEDLGDGQDLEQIHSGQGLSQQDLEACADLLSLALVQGLHHPDLHLGNFFRKKDGSLHLLDLHSASFRDRARAVRASAFRPLYLSLAWPEQRSQRQVVFPRLGLPTDPQQLPAWRLSWLTRRLSRCLRDSGSFYWRDSLGQRRDCRFTTAELLQAMDTAEILKQGRRGAVLRSSLGIHKIRKSGRSRKLWLACEALALRGIPHPRALAWMPLRGGQGSILCEDLAQARGLDEITAAEAPPLARDLGRSFGRLHGSGWRFRDARGDNFLVQDQRVFFVDLDGCSPISGFRPEEACAKDLGRLLAWLRHQAPTNLREQSRTWERIFLRSYIHQRRAMEGKPRSLHSFCRQIALRSEAWRKSHT
jgi:tRNA A-37 threonylcarbamoyl transferase component Bud32